MRDALKSVEEEILEILKTRLSLNVKIENHYCGGEIMYQDYVTVQLLLDGEVISEASL